MSLKAYDGMFIPKPDITLAQVERVRKQIAEAALPIRRAHERERIGLDAAITLLGYKMGLRPDDDGLFHPGTFDAHSLWMASVVNALGRDERAEEDAWLDMWLVADRGLLLHVRCQHADLQSQYTRAAIDSGLALDWCFWDNSDRPASVPEAEWDQRRLDWNTGLEGDMIPLDVWPRMSGGFSTINDPPSSEEMTERIVAVSPTALSRVVTQVAYRESGSTLPQFVDMMRASAAAVRDDNHQIISIVADLLHGIDREKDLRAAVDALVRRVLAQKEN